MLFCGLTNGISSKMCILCVRVCFNLFVFGTCFRMLAVILFQIKKIQTPTVASLINHALTDAFIHIPQFRFSTWSLKTKEHFCYQILLLHLLCKGLANWSESIFRGQQLYRWIKIQKHGTTKFFIWWLSRRQKLFSFSAHHHPARTKVNKARMYGAKSRRDHSDN